MQPLLSCTCNQSISSETKLTIETYTRLPSVLRSRIINNQSDGSMHPLIVPFTHSHGFWLVFTGEAFAGGL